MGLNTSKCNHLTPLRFKGLKLINSVCCFFAGKVAVVLTRLMQRSLCLVNRSSQMTGAISLVESVLLREPLRPLCFPLPRFDGPWLILNQCDFRFDLILVLVLVLVFQLLFSFCFVLVFVIFRFSFSFASYFLVLVSFQKTCWWSALNTVHH